ncbi:MAG: hypothetical protein J3R72DRAFT_202815 [Linnemannia gamsii]|nr:MAG: hypothetical protein J3R72DRAFT_202815 [Linnemannia gamsii]
MSEQPSNDGRMLNPGDNRRLAASISCGEYDHFLLPVLVVANYVEDGIGYGSSLFRLNETTGRADYAAILETAAPAVSAEAMHTFRRIVAAYEPPTTNSSNALQQDNRAELSRLKQCGTRRLPEYLNVMYEVDCLTDSALLETNTQTRMVTSVLSFVDEVMTHRLSRRECGKFAMRNLQLMHRVATIAAQQAEGDVVNWFFGVVDWCIRTAHLIEDGTACYDSCCALLLEIGTMRMITAGDRPPSCFLDNHAINVLRQGAVAVFGIALMFSGLPATQLIFQAARLEYWLSWSFGQDKPPMTDHSNVRAMVAESGRQAGLCYARVYQWAAANWQHGYSFAEWCTLKRRWDVASPTGDVIDVQHLDCGARCEHGRSATAGHVGHLPWCEGRSVCTVTHIPEQSGSGLLVFDTKMKELRDLRSGESYVAVSHVWGQRLFGQDTRSLGRCAIAELKRLADANRVACVWLDTLCVPSEPVARRICIDGMRAIYMNATCVAVYDRGIMKADIMDPTGFAFEVSISDWNSRVWTLQEGFLNSVVVYVQQGRYIRHRRIRVHPFLQWHSVAMAGDLLSLIGTGRRAMMQPHEVFKFAAGRTTSHSVDYVCGLGALLPGPIARVDADLTTAAVAMARILGEVDVGVLCAYSPRVKVKGYSWMPLGCQEMNSVHEFGITCTVLDDDLGLYLESEALHVGELSRFENPSEALRDLQRSRGGHLHTNGTIDILVPIGADLQGSYDFICTSSVQGHVAGGFLVAEHDDAYEYVSPATAIAKDGQQLSVTRNPYIIQ